MDKKPPMSPPVPPGRVGRQENGFYNPPAATTVKLATPPVPADRVGSTQREFYEVPDDTKTRACKYSKLSALTKTPEPAYGYTEPWKPDFDALIEALGRPYAPTPRVAPAPDRLSPRGQLDRDGSKVDGLAQVGLPGTVETPPEDAQPQRHQDEHPVTLRPSAIEEEPECSPLDKQEEACDIITPPPTDPRLRASPGDAPQPHKGPSKGPQKKDTAPTEAPKLGTSVPAPPDPAPAPAHADAGPIHATVAAPQLRRKKPQKRAERSRRCHLTGTAPLHARPPDTRRQRQTPQGIGARSRRRRRR
ncbi:protein tonB2-like [Cydia splendana]|uniref:protein tonB2-like n=1 Tax=Cydia splendana TaxID=1100963 RepID=UPI00300C2C44